MRIRFFNSARLLVAAILCCGLSAFADRPTHGGSSAKNAGHVSGESASYGREYAKEWKAKYEATYVYFRDFEHFKFRSSPGVIDTMQFLKEYREAISNVASPNSEQAQLAVFLDHCLEWIHSNMGGLKKVTRFSGVKSGVRERGLMVARYLLEKGERNWSELEKKLYAALDTVSVENDGQEIDKKDLLETAFEDEHLIRLLAVMKNPSRVAKNP